MAWITAALVALTSLASTTPVPLTPVAELEAIGRSRAAIEAVGSGRVECFVGDDLAVHYTGPTDDNLLACISEFSVDGRSLVVSSGGGDALKAIEAGNALARLGWGIRVVGMCASSCGNYLVPAATSISVEPYSAILLHGGPINSESYIRAVQDQAEAQQRAAYPAVTDELVQQGRDIMRSVMIRLFEEHRIFVERYGIADEWYRLSEFSGPEGGFTPADFAVVDPAYLARQLPRVDQASYWFPCSPEERAAFAALISSSGLFYRPSQS